MSIFDFMKKHFLLSALLLLVFCSKENVSKTETSLDTVEVSMDSLSTNAEDSLNLEKINAREIRILNNEILDLLKTKNYA